MRLLVVLCLVGVALSVPRPNFRYAYMIPQEGDRQPWSQFNQKTDDNYAWGYEYPGRAHFESKDEEGVVKGTFGYVDANGAPVVWQYSSHPNTGFQVNTGTGHVLPQVEEVGSEPAAPAVYSGNAGRTTFNFPSNTQFVEHFVSPLLKSAASAGEVIPVGSSPSGTPQYAVDPEIAEEAGGVSALAERYGAIPVAAVHDVQSRPSIYTGAHSAFSPVLVHHEEPDFTLYTLEVPIQ